LSARPSRQAQAALVNVLLLGGIIAHTQASDPGADATSLAPVKVTANADDSTDGYVARKSSVGTKTDTPLVEVPQSISVVTRQQMDVQQPQSLNEALRYSVGVVVQQWKFVPARHGSEPAEASVIVPLQFELRC
jgi:outer membrane receptor for ferric coprogen and ferric-rhodotorulic acid